MELSTDLSAHALAEALPGRPVRSYPAMLSTEADALAWARAGADDGAVVVAGYQAAPRELALHDALLAKHGASVIVGACGCRCHGVSVG